VEPNPIYAGPAQGFFDADVFCEQMGDLELSLIFEGRPTQHTHTGLGSDAHMQTYVSMFYGYGATVKYSRFCSERGGMPQAHVQVYAEPAREEILTERLLCRARTYNTRGLAHRVRTRQRKSGVVLHTLERKR